jgi:hypothetical protein
MRSLFPHNTLPDCGLQLGSILVSLATPAGSAAVGLCRIGDPMRESRTTHFVCDHMEGQ